MKKLKWGEWFYALLKTTIGGAAAAGSAWLGTAVGAQISEQVKPLDLTQLGFVLASSVLLNLFFYLKQSPLPAVSDTVFIEKPKE